MNIEKIPLEDLFEHLNDAIPTNPKGPSGPYTGRELFSEVKRRLTMARAFEVAADLQLPLGKLFPPPVPLQT